MLFCDICYVSTDAAYVKKFGANFIFSHCRHISNRWIPYMECNIIKIYSQLG